MQLTSIQLSTGGLGSGPQVHNAAVEIGGSTYYRQIVVIGGPSTSLAGVDLVEPGTTAPSSAVYALPVRLAPSSTDAFVGMAGVSTSVGLGALDPRTRTWTLSTAETIGVVAGSTIDVRLAASSSSVVVTALLSTANGGAAIDPRARTWALSTGESVAVAAASSNGIGMMLSTAANSSYIDPRTRSWSLSTGESVSVAAASSVLMGIAISTAANSSYIDPRTRTWTLSTADVTAVVGAGTSGLFGTALLSTASGGAAIDPRQATIVGATSGAGLGTILSTGAGGAAIDPRGRTWNLSTADVAAVVGTGSSAALGTVLISTAVGQAAIDPRARNWTLSTGETVTQRSLYDSTSVNMKYFYTTGLVAPTASTMQSLNQVTNWATGSSGTSFNVAAGRIFRIEHVEASIRATSGALLWADFVIRAVTSTAGSTGTSPVVYYKRLVTAAPTSAAVGGGASFDQSGLSIDLPSSGSFGVSIVAASSASNEVTFGMGGREYVI